MPKYKRKSSPPIEHRGLTDKQRKLLRAAGMGAGAGAIGHVGYRVWEPFHGVHKLRDNSLKLHPELRNVEVPPPPPMHYTKDMLRRDVKKWGKFALKGAAVGLPIGVIAHMISEKMKRKKGEHK